MGRTVAKTFKRFLNASTSKEMHESQGSLSYKQTPKSSKISEFQTISNNFTKTIKNRLNFVGFCLGILDKISDKTSRNKSQKISRNSLAIVIVRKVI